ncbi:MAG TPA: universal stress protein [Gaiellaceae bacterium]|jgi:nucleotide-binding universal stress UspA family protein
MAPRGDDPPWRSGPIVVGYDGSEAAQRAADRAVALAGPGGRVALVAAFPPPVESLENELTASPARGELVDLLREGSARCAGRDVDVSWRLVEGEPAEALADVGREIDASLIVVGARGDSFVARTLRGSVAEKLVARAHCDVLAVR